jgi:high-affinity iron transporter
MLGQYLITFREVLEAALIISIIFAFLTRIDKEELVKHVWNGVKIAIFASIITAIAIWMIYGGLSSTDSKLFEGIAALIAVAVLTTMILWMAFKGKYIKDEVQNKVESVIKKGTVYGLIGLGFVVVFREAFETILFLIPFAANDINGTLVGAVLGLITSLIIAYMIFKVGLRINLKRFFFLSSLLLIFLAAGLLGYGIHELFEYQEAVGNDPGWLGSIAYDIGISGDNIFHHKGVIGSIFAVMFGYSVKMEWGRIIIHLSYLIIFGSITIILYKKPQTFKSFLNAMNKITISRFPAKNLLRFKRNLPSDQRPQK